MNEFFGKIIDTHAHIYPEKIASKAVDAIGKFYSIPMCEDGMVETLTRLGREAGVSHFVVHSLATTPKQVVSINNYIYSECQKDPSLIGFATLHPGLSERELNDEVERVISMGMQGIKLHPDFQQFFADDPEVFKMYEAVEGRLPILFHAGDNRYTFSAPERIINIAKEFPLLDIIAAHFGAYSCWERSIFYKGLDNVYFDTCSTLAFLDKDRAAWLINYLGEDRFMFSTDFPMWKPKEETERFLALKLTDAQREKILYKNAERIILKKR